MLQDFDLLAVKERLAHKRIACRHQFRQHDAGLLVVDAWLEEPIDEIDGLAGECEHIGASMRQTFEFKDGMMRTLPLKRAE